MMKMSDSTPADHQVYCNRHVGIRHALYRSHRPSLAP